MSCSTQLSNQYTQQNAGMAINILLNNPIPAVIEIDTSFLQSTGVKLFSVESKSDDKSQSITAVPADWKIVYVPQLTDTNFWNGFAPSDTVNYWTTSADGTKQTGSIAITKTGSSIPLTTYKLLIGEPLPASLQFSLDSYAVLNGFKISSVGNLNQDICQDVEISADKRSITYYPDQQSGYWFSKNPTDNVTLNITDSFTGEENSISISVYRNQPNTPFQAADIMISKEMYYHKNKYISIRTSTGLCDYYKCKHL